MVHKSGHGLSLKQIKTSENGDFFLCHHSHHGTPYVFYFRSLGHLQLRCLDEKMHDKLLRNWQKDTYGDL